MTNEEKLRDIVRKAAAFSLPSNTQEFHLDMFTNSLMASGVKIGKNTNVPRWIPVTERLPTDEDANEYGYVLGFDKSENYSIWHKSHFENHPEWFTHWTNLLDAPKDGDT